jgi:hypothetical protein
MSATPIEGVSCRFKQRRVSHSNKVTVSVAIRCDERFEFSLRRERFTQRHGGTSSRGRIRSIEAAMALVAHTHALIFDLPDNRGGAPVTIAFTYLFDRSHPSETICIPVLKTQRPSL